LTQPSSIPRADIHIKAGRKVRSLTQRSSIPRADIHIKAGRKVRSLTQRSSIPRADIHIKAGKGQQFDLALPQHQLLPPQNGR